MKKFIYLLMLASSISTYANDVCEILRTNCKGDSYVSTVCSSGEKESRYRADKKEVLKLIENYTEHGYKIVSRNERLTRQNCLVVKTLLLKE